VPTCRMGASCEPPRDAGRSSPRNVVVVACLPMDRRRPLLLNLWEVRTDAALTVAADRCGVRVCAKVRLASALSLDRPGLSDEEFAYGLRAEFDFVIADGSNALTQFAVEFDEPHHLTEPKTLRRDRLKAAVCERLGIPLVQIGSEYLQRQRRFTLIGYLVEVWHLERAFDEAQRRGDIPWDEPFIPENVLADSLDSAVDFPYWLDRPARLRMVDAERAGWLVSRVPEELITPWPTGETDEAEFIEAWAVLALHKGGYVMGQAKLRNFRVFVPGVTARSLASKVAVADAGRQLERVLAGDGPPSSPEDFAILRARTDGWISQGGVAS
jgi:hypothetical protein